MNIWLLLIIIFLIGLLILITGVTAKKRLARAVGLTSVLIVLIIAAVLIFVNKDIPVASEVFKFIQ